MLIRPTPFPEELDRGYLGRVMRKNGADTEKYAVELMATWAGVAEKTRREVSCLELLSKVAEVDLPIFVRQHSTLPLRRAITSYQPDLAHGSEQNRSMLWTTGMRLARTGVYFCAECVHEDQGFHGESYWRREHQIPGVLWCSKHITPLKYTEKESALLLPPSVQLQHCQSVDQAWFEESLENEAIKRYVEICFNLLGTKTPFNVRHVSDVLKVRATELGYQTYGGKVKLPLLSDAIIEAFGRKWLSTVLPALADKPKGDYLSQMDGVLYLKTSASSVSAYVLALAVMYESVDVALNALQSDLVVAKRKRRPSAQFTREELIDAYIQGRGNYSAIAALMSLDKFTVANKFKAAGLPNLVQKTKQNVFKAVVAFYIEELSLSASAAKGNISIETLEELIRNVSSEFTQAIRTMCFPTSGRGSGIRRAKQLTPYEASQAKGAVATKFSHRIRSEQLRALELRKNMDTQYRA